MYLEEAHDVGLVDVGLGAGGPRRGRGDGEQEERGRGAAAGGVRGREVWGAVRGRRRRRRGLGWPEEEAEQRLERHVVASRGKRGAPSLQARSLSDTWGRDV